MTASPPITSTAAPGGSPAPPPGVSLNATDPSHTSMGAHSVPMTGASRFLIVSWDGGGNAPPALNLASRLVAAGQRVMLLGWESMRARADAAGAEFSSYPSVAPWPRDLAFEDALD